MHDHPGSTADSTGGGAVRVSLTRPPTNQQRALRVTLIRPPVVVMPHSLAAHGPIPPIGLAYVAAAVRSAGHHVELIDAPGEALDQWEPFDTPVGEVQRIGLRPEQIVERIDPAAHVVGITNMFQHEWPQVRALLPLVRERFPDALIVMGGENATAFRHWIMEQAPEVDVVVMGEGEATMIELLDRWSADQPIADLPGVVARDGADRRAVDTGLPTRLKATELDIAARPAWDLVPLEGYWAHFPFLGVNRGRSMPVLGTRGCPYKCTFCSSPQMWTTRYVMREPTDVVDEIVEYVRDFGVENVNFVDLTAATNRKWILELCDQLERRAPGVTWQLPIGTRAEAIDAEVLQRLWDTGCRNISLCPESGSERMIEVYDKRVKLPHILESVRNARAVGIWTVVHIIIGHPEERWSDVWKSTKFLVTAALEGCSDAAVIMFCPYPGSKDFQDLLDSGELEIDESAYYVGLLRSSSSNRSWNRRMSSRQLRLLQLAMLSVFYGTAMLRHPSRIGVLLKGLRGRGEETYLDQVVRTLRRNLTPAAGGTGPADDATREVA